MKDICIRDLSKSFGSRKVFDSLNLTIRGGMTTCIMATSGAGKTTLLRILMGLENADGGSVTGLEESGLALFFRRSGCVRT